MHNKTISMTARTLLAGAILGLAAVPSWAAVNVQLDIGVPPPVVVAPAAPMVVPEPGAMVAPAMVWSPEFGAYIALDAADPLLYMGGVYYYFSGGIWLSGPNYWGPWVRVARLPYGLRGFRPHDWGRYQQQAHGRMADPHWRQFHPAAQPGMERGREPGRGPGHEPDRGYDHGHDRDRDHDRP